MKRLLALAVFLSACTSICGAPPNLERKHLLNRLHDARPAARITAIRELSEIADLEALVAIEKSREDAPEDVRREVAAAFGRSQLPEAIDKLGTLLRDPADSVRAAAVKALAGKTGERAAAYIVSAYGNGGPLTREAVSQGPAMIFRRAVAAEAADWRKTTEEHRKDSHAQVRAGALAELGRDATEPIIAELAARLEDPDPITASAAAAGLLNAHAVDQVPALVSALHSSSPLVVGAAAVALRGLGIGSLSRDVVATALVEALGKADGNVAEHILDAFESITLLDPLPPNASIFCEFEKRTTDLELAKRAERSNGYDCFEQNSQNHLVAAAYLAESTNDVRGHAVLARELLKDPDAGVAKAAADFLAGSTDKSDGDLLLATARAQLERIKDLRKTREEEKIKAASPSSGMPPQPPIKSLFDNINQKLATASVNPLVEKLRKMKTSDQTISVEERPGAIAFLTAATAGAVALHVDADEFARELLAEQDSSIRMAALPIANGNGAEAEELRTRLRTDSDPAVQLEMYLLDYRAKRDGAMDHISYLLPQLDASGRARLASALADEAATLKALYLSFLEASDIATPIAAEALARVPGEDIDHALAQCLAAKVPVGRYVALGALADRAGPENDAAIAMAAVHPSADLREAATQALIDRKACAYAERLAPLAADYSGTVRANVAKLRQECGAKP